MADRNIPMITANRALATLAILICHTIKYYSFIPLHEILGNFFDVGVPLFIIISGYLYGFRSIKAQNEERASSFLFNRWMKVCLPVHLWAAALLIANPEMMRIHFFTILLNLQGLSSLINLPIGVPVECGLSQSWFVTFILACYALIPFLKRIIAKFTKYHIIAIWIIAFILPLVGVIPCGLALFVTSYYLGNRNLKIEKTNTLLLIFMFGVAVILRIAGHLYLDDTFVYLYLIVPMTHYLLAGSIFAFTAKMTSNPIVLEKVVKNTATRFINRHSYSIYIVHYCFIRWLYQNYSLAAATIAFLLLTLLFSCALDFVCQKSGEMIRRYALLAV